VIEAFEFHRMHEDEAYFDPEFRFNNRFEVTKLRGGIIWNGEDIRFSESSPEFSKLYKSVFGPCFHSNTVLTNSGNDGLCGAIRRITAMRRPEIPGYHQMLIDKQYEAVDLYENEILEWTTLFQERLRNILIDQPGPDELRQLWTHQAHAKKKLRVKTEEEFDQVGKADLPEEVTHISYKTKPGEFLAQGKHTRAVGDLGPLLTLVLAYFMDFIKAVFAERFTFNHVELQHIKKPEKELLKEMYDELIHPIGGVFKYYSDDSCFGCECLDGTFMSNIDISQCDGSNYNPVFDILEEAMKVDERYENDIISCFEQLELPFKIVSADRTQSAVFVPRMAGERKQRILYSGSVLTTSVNNMANTLIAIAISRNYHPRMMKADIPAMIVAAAESVGFRVKIDVCHTYHDLQFLKTSPAMVSGKIVPYQNLGAWLRGFGMFTGDVPGSSKIPLIDRCRIFNSDVVKSRVHSGDHIIHEAFKSHIVNATLSQPDTFNMLVGEDHTFIPTDELALRYKVSVSSLEELASQIVDMQVSEKLWSPVLDSIFSKDYGY
jgi:hypothetical protein